MKKSKIVRFIYIVIGLISLGLGIVGIILPILPTTPFFLLTSFCFVRGSKRFSDWFLNSKLYKKHLENFAKNKVMTIQGELLLLGLVSLMLFTTMILSDNLVVSIILLILICIKYSYFIFRVKTISKEEYKELLLKRKMEKEKELEGNE